MKKTGKILVAALITALILSATVIGTSDASAAGCGTLSGNKTSCFGSVCTQAEAAQCPYGLSIASRLGILCMCGCTADCGADSGNTTTAVSNTGTTCTATTAATFNTGTACTGNTTVTSNTGTTCTGSKTLSNSLSGLFAKYRTVVEKYFGTASGCGAAQNDETTVPTDSGTTPAEVEESAAPTDAGTTPDVTSAPADTGTAPTADEEVTVPADDATESTLSFEEQVVALVNEQRAANGLAPLTLSQTLSNAARAKSQDMHDNNYFSHTSPTYGSPFEMLSTFGISYRTAGENIAMGYATPEAVMNGWMNSAGHRANILNANYTQIGVGYVADGNYWTQEFIG